MFRTSSDAIDLVSEKVNKTKVLLRARGERTLLAMQNSIDGEGMEVLHVESVEFKLQKSGAYYVVIKSFKN